MRVNLIALCLLPLIGTSCVGVKSTDDAVQVSLIRKGPDKTLLAITTKVWEGTWDSQGMVGYQTISYWAALAGPGPSYPNPSFIDTPEYQCTGTITLDRVHNTVEVQMQRIVSKAGEDYRTSAHPANGVYNIDVAREALPEERWF